MIAADIMTSPVITIEENETVQTCAERLLENGISALPVVDSQDRLVGIISEGDLMRRQEIGAQLGQGSWWLAWLRSRESQAEDFVASNTQRIADLMTRDVVTAKPTSDLGEVASLLEKHRVKRLPVVDDGAVIGVISRANLVQAVASQGALKLRSKSGAKSDRELRETLLANLRKESWFSSTHLNVMVNDGVVELYGVANSDAERRAAQVVAENLAGVKEVRDHRVVLQNVRHLGA